MKPCFFSSHCLSLLVKKKKKKLGSFSSVLSLNVAPLAHFSVKFKKGDKKQIAKQTKNFSVTSARLIETNKRHSH